MSDTLDSVGTAIPSELVRGAFATARALGLPVGRDVVALFWPISMALLRVVRAGGTWQQLGPLTEWHIQDFDVGQEVHTRFREQLGADLVLAEPEPGLLHHAAGNFRLHWQGTDYLLIGCSVAQLRCSRGGRDGPMMVTPNRALLLGPTRTDLVALLNALRVALTGPRLRLWGGIMEEATPPDTPEAAVILPEELKRDLLAWTDRFWSLVPAAREHGLPMRRGLLLVGDPGTGKTQLIRHLLSRYPAVPAHLFVAQQRTSGDPFGTMLSALRRTRGGAIVVLEDIDRLADSGAITTEYLLNCLDGLLEIEGPVLWVATANDPTKLESNLLRRPGRFDRTVVIPLPDAEGRRRLVRQFATLPLTDAEVSHAVMASDRLTGAHIRQALASATLAVCDGAGSFGKDLLGEIQKLRRELEQVSRFEEELGRQARAGFAAGAC